MNTSGEGRTLTLRTPGVAIEEGEPMTYRKHVYVVTVGYAEEELIETVTVVATTPENARVKAYLMLDENLGSIDIDKLDFGTVATLALRDVKE